MKEVTDYKKHKAHLIRESVRSSVYFNLSSLDVAESEDMLFDKAEYLKSAIADAVAQFVGERIEESLCDIFPKVAAKAGALKIVYENREFR